jgi:hypothetical protein
MKIVQVRPGASGRDIHRGQRDLEQGHPPLRQFDPVPAQPERANGQRQREIDDDDRPQQRTSGMQCAHRQILTKERDRGRLQEQDRSAEHETAQTEGQAAKCDGLADLQRRQSPMGVQAVSHGRPGHRRETQIMRQRVGAE